MFLKKNLEADHLGFLCTLMQMHLCITLDNNLTKVIQKHFSLIIKT
jgi:hypothetical protein